MTDSRASIVMPRYNSGEGLWRAIASVKRERFFQWQLLIVDDCSTDGSDVVVRQIAKQDARMGVLQTQENSGPSAARNIGLAAARGEFVAYLDCDDEFYPDYLERVAQFAGKADVLVFGYDFVDDATGKRRTWDATEHRGDFFQRNLSVPLGIAHRRDLIERVGGFDESLWMQEDWEFWKRLARSGAEFLYLPFKSGLYHIRPGSRSRAPRITARQARLYAENRKAGRPLYFGGLPSAPAAAAAPKRVEKLVFASPCCLVDRSSGAAVATRRLLEELGKGGIRCQAFCAAKMDFGEEACPEQELAELGLPYETRWVEIEAGDTRPETGGEALDFRLETVGAGGNQTRDRRP